MYSLCHAFILNSCILMEVLISEKKMDFNVSTVKERTKFILFWLNINLQTESPEINVISLFKGECADIPVPLW